MFFPHVVRIDIVFFLEKSQEKSGKKNQEKCMNPALSYLVPESIPISNV